MSLHKLVLVVTVALAGLNCGCASRSATLGQLDGSEPQRLSSGDPKTVQTHFAEKVRTCWFGGSTPLLQGYRYETASLSNVADIPPDEANTPHIRIFGAEAQNRAAFEVEFHSFNDNTLISTRNLSLPMELAARLKRDVETWIFGDKGCGSSSASLTAAEHRLYDPKPTTSVGAHQASWPPGNVASASPPPAAHADAATR